MKMFYKPVLPGIVLLIVKDKETSGVIAPTYAISSSRKWQWFTDLEQPLKRDLDRLKGSLQKVPAGVMKYKAMTAIQGMLLHNWKLIRRRKKIIVVVPSC